MVTKLNFRNGILLGFIWGFIIGINTGTCLFLIIK